MKIYYNFLNFYITTLFIINILIKTINNHYNHKSIKLKKLDNEQNVIEIEMKNNLSGNQKFINIENDDNDISMFVNNKPINFNNSIEFDENTNYKIKLILTDYFNGDCQNMFSYSEIKTIKFQNFNICKNMSYMFCNYSSLESIDLSSFNASNVINIKYMFYGCSSLQSLNFSSFNTSNVNDMQYMFYGCSLLESLNSLFNTSNVKNMSQMFYGCSKLQSLNLSLFNTSKIENMEYMFYECNSLDILYLSNLFIIKMINILKICFLIILLK